MCFVLERKNLVKQILKQSLFLAENGDIISMFAQMLSAIAAL